MHAPFRAPSSRVLRTWILLLAGAQLADVLTTWVDMEHGGIEANRFVSALLAVGGLGLVFVLKLLLVMAMGISCLLIKRYADRHPSFQARAANAFVWRAMQLSVVGLVVVALHNAAVLAQIA
jgi:Na+-transporting methylmalonyl-CoA/oxaloacetate decarboxylase gamma subunit